VDVHNRPKVFKELKVATRKVGVRVRLENRFDVRAMLLDKGDVRLRVTRRVDQRHFPLADYCVGSMG